jgi:hypothetical protein
MNESFFPSSLLCTLSLAILATVFEHSPSVALIVRAYSGWVLLYSLWAAQMSFLCVA